MQVEYKTKHKMKNVITTIWLLLFSTIAFSQLDTVNTGSSPGSGDGDVLRIAFSKVNQAIKKINAKDTIVNLTQTSGYTASEGDLYYETGTRSLAFINDIDGFVLNIGHEQVRRVYNGTGSTITNGSVVRRVGTYHDGDIIASVALAGNSTKDSAYVYGIATVDIPAGQEGEVTVGGAVRGINLSAYNDTNVYLGYGGSIVDTCPTPPNICVPLGIILYADADSGLIDVDIRDFKYYPNPKIALDTSDLNADVTINTQNVYEYIPVSSAALRHNYGFNFVGDSAQVLVGGGYDVLLSSSFQGNPTAETWHYGVFVNGTVQTKKTRTTSTSDAGDVTVFIHLELEVGDWVSCKIRNTSGTGDPTIVDLVFSVEYKN